LEVNLATLRLLQVHMGRGEQKLTATFRDRAETLGSRESFVTSFCAELDGSNSNELDRSPVAPSRVGYDRAAAGIDRGSVRVEEWHSVPQGVLLKLVRRTADAIALRGRAQGQAAIEFLGKSPSVRGTCRGGVAIRRYSTVTEPISVGRHGEAFVERKRRGRLSVQGSGGSVTITDSLVHVVRHRRADGVDDNSPSACRLFLWRKCGNGIRGDRRRRAFVDSLDNCQGLPPPLGITKRGARSRTDSESHLQEGARTHGAESSRRGATIRASL
jgi:hypothetical protein